MEEGIALLRDGYPDWLLLRRGDVFDGALGQWKLSGRSPAEPMLVGAYGDEPVRPLFRTGLDTGILIQGGGDGPERVSYIAFVGLHFYAHTRDPNTSDYGGLVAGGNGVRWLRGTDWLLIEDCVFQSYGMGLLLHDFDGLGLHNVAVRRTMVLDSYQQTGQCDGMWVQGVSNLTVEECVFDGNGWSAGAGVPRAVSNGGVRITDDGSETALRNNVFMRGGAYGIFAAGGESIVGNIMSHNPTGVLFAMVMAEASTSGTVARNVILKGVDISEAVPRGWGIALSDGGGMTIRENIVAHVAGSDPRAIDDVDNAVYGGNVVYGWGVSPFATPGPFRDPERTLGSYSAAIDAGGTLESLADRLRQRPPQSWPVPLSPQAIGEYVRSGFAAP